MNSSKPGSGRRRWTSKQRQRLLARFHQSQLTQHDFATQHGVGLSTLSKWLRYGAYESLAKSRGDLTLVGCWAHVRRGFHEALLGSCRRQGINPFDYLKDLITRLPAAKITQIKEFTQAAWAKPN